MDWMQWFHGWVALAALVSVIASQKGRSGVRWLVYALVALPIALIHVLALEPRKPQGREAAAQRQQVQQQHTTELPDPALGAAREASRGTPLAQHRRGSTLPLDATP